MGIKAFKMRNVFVVTVQEEEQDTGMHDDSDPGGTPEMPQTSELLQLRQQVQQLNTMLDELRATVCSLE